MEAPGFASVNAAAPSGATARRNERNRALDNENARARHVASRLRDMKRGAVRPGAAVSAPISKSG
jgi:hypothetical protein